MKPKPKKATNNPKIAIKHNIESKETNTRD